LQAIERFPTSQAQLKEMNNPKTVDISEVQAAFIAERGGVMTISTSGTVFG